LNFGIAEQELGKSEANIPETHNIVNAVPANNLRYAKPLSCVKG
jgi:hypothetical protein